MCIRQNVLNAIRMFTKISQSCSQANCAAAKYNQHNESIRFVFVCIHCCYAFNKHLRPYYSHTYVHVYAATPTDFSGRTHFTSILTQWLRMHASHSSYLLASLFWFECGNIVLRPMNRSIAWHCVDYEILNERNRQLVAVQSNALGIGDSGSAPNSTTKHSFKSVLPCE